ncbi:MAG TPA: hypothetical protein VHA56_20420 [Mucilaginibacter sp.]|nr:hypothetical protein [Mucilaginibacter sp.]
MKTLLNKWFIAGCLVWLLIFLSRKTGHPIPYLNGYIDDLFAVPVICNLALFSLRRLIVKSDHYTLSPGHVIFVVVYVTFAFEILLPMLSKTYTADWLDVVLYVIGGVFFYKVMNRPVIEERSVQ